MRNDVLDAAGVDVRNYVWVRVLSENERWRRIR
jgi:hypothetical protein